jgi:hypothetical protein
MPETYGPTILAKKAKAMRKKDKKANVYAPIELEHPGLREIFVVVLTRPIRMFLFEAIVLASCLYLSIIYAIFYSRPVGNSSTDHFLINLQCFSNPSR